MLQVRPSFLSAIENGRSRMPEEKLEKIMEIFEIDNMDDYTIEDTHENTVPPPTHALDQSDTLAQLLNNFHELSHQREKEHSSPDSESAVRIEFLTSRNDRLSERVDDLREEVDRLREENLRLKELLIKEGTGSNITANMLDIS